MILLKACGLFLVLINVAIADFRNDALDVHNEFRSRHNSPFLSLNNELNYFAQNYAKKLAAKEKLEPSGGKYGENLEYIEIGGSSDVTDSEIARIAVQTWYLEESEYSYDKPGFSTETEHFTAVVWKDTKFLGIGIARRGQKAYVTASYYPAGNKGTLFRENVLRPNSGSNCAPKDYLQWVTQDETLPAGFSAIESGIDINNQTHRICRAKHSSGDLIPGKLVGERCHVSYGGKEYNYEGDYRYAVYRQVDGCPSLNWVTTPWSFDGGVHGGKTASGETLFVARCPLPQFGPNVSVPGKVHENDKSKAYYGFGGQELKCTKYDVLMLD